MKINPIQPNYNLKQNQKANKKPAFGALYQKTVSEKARTQLELMLSGKNENPLLKGLRETYKGLKEQGYDFLITAFGTKVNHSDGIIANFGKHEQTPLRLFAVRTGEDGSVKSITSNAQHPLFYQEAAERADVTFHDSINNIETMANRLESGMIELIATDFVPAEKAKVHTEYSELDGPIYTPFSRLELQA